MTFRWHLFIALSTLIMISGCSSTPEPRLFDGNFTANDDINPDHEGRPSPIIVKTYHLKGITTFNEADFFSLYDEGKKYLGEDFIAIEEHVLQPGEDTDYILSISPDATYLAVVAAYRDLENAQWRATLEIPEEGFFDFMKSRVLQIKATDLEISIDFIKK